MPRPKYSTIASLKAEIDRYQATDSINHPKHYTQGKIESIDVVEDWNLGFHDGNALKYIARWRHKGGVEDLKKAAWYLNRLISSLSKS